MTTSAFGYIVFYGPAVLGAAILLIPIALTWRIAPHIVALFVAIAFYLLSYFVIRRSVDFGEAWSGQGSLHNLPERVMTVSLTFSGVILGLKFLLIEARRRVRSDQAEP